MPDTKEKTINVALTEEQIGHLLVVLDRISGMENARALLPIYDVLKNASTE